MDWTISGATTPGQSGTGSNGNEGVYCIPQSYSINGGLPLDCLVTYPGHLLGESYPFAKMQMVSSTNPAIWAIHLSKMFICVNSGPIFVPFEHIHRIFMFWPFSVMLIDLYSCSDFQFIYSPFQAFGEFSNQLVYNWYHRHPHFP